VHVAQLEGSYQGRRRREFDAHELLVFAVVLAALAPAGQRNPWSTGKVWDDGRELTEIGDTWVPDTYGDQMSD
jgi:hypothetical protein